MEYPGKLIKRGDEGEAVGLIQERLAVQQTKLYGPTTEENVTKFQRSRGLTPDGIVGPKTWKALFAPEPKVGIGLAALEEAKKRVGVKEKPLGSNRGPEVDDYNETAGVPKGSFWCMSFVYTCVKIAAEKQGVTVPMLRTASCSALYRWAKKEGRLVSRPQPGDIFLCIGGERGHYHTGFVAGPVSNERFRTIEGNSNSDGSANGIEVAARSPGRRVTSCNYVRL